MDHSDFKIGTLFRTGSGLWRCTDVGTRTIAAIHLDELEADGTRARGALSRDEAEAQGLFRGPPYVVVEFVFDEYDFGGCEPENLDDSAGYGKRPSKPDLSQAVRGPWREGLATLRGRHGEADKAETAMTGNSFAI